MHLYSVIIYVPYCLISTVASLILFNHTLAVNFVTVEKKEYLQSNERT